MSRLPIHGTMKDHASDSIGLLQTLSKRFFPPRYRGAQRTSNCTTTGQHHQVRPGSRAHSRSNESLQHDVRPCFMDANQWGSVHEFEHRRHQKILDQAISIKPRRQMSVQFSRWRADPLATLPGSNSLTRARWLQTVFRLYNGIEFARVPSRQKAAAAAGCATLICSLMALGTPQLSPQRRESLT